MTPLGLLFSGLAVIGAIILTTLYFVFVSSKIGILPINVDAIVIGIDILIVVGWMTRRLTESVIDIISSNILVALTAMFIIAAISIAFADNIKGIFKK